MFPEEYRSILVSLAEEDEDMKTLLGLFHRLKGYTTEETLVKNFTALTGKDCKELLKTLRKRGILKIGAHNEYLCLSGYEEFFDEVAHGYSLQPGDLSKYIERAVEEGDRAALKLIELVLKISKHGVPGLTHYELIRDEMSELFSPAVFHSLDGELIKEKLCVYAKKRDEEFLEFYQSGDTIKEVKERLRVWKTNKLAELPVKQMLEQEIEGLVADAKRGIGAYSAEMAEMAGLSETEVEKTVGYFSGFDVDDVFLFVTGNVLVDYDSLYVAITDSLSRYEAREWRDYPVLFITAELPKWIGTIEGAFKDAYPKLSERRMAIVVPNEVAYANFKQKLLFELVNRLGVTELSEIPKIGERTYSQTSLSKERLIDEFYY
ncbi:MAG: hypothetical protein IBX41_05465 [Methanophagales archaeon]|nr:hypothetical protein [Methanophagales archaeon]